MRSSASRLTVTAAALILAACGGNDKPPASPIICPLGQTPGPNSTCLVADAGTTIPTCTAADKPVEATTAPPQEVVLHVATAAVGQVLDFTVPANTASVTIVEQAVSALDFVRFNGSPLSNTAVPLRVTAPGNVVVYDDSVPFPADISTLNEFFASESPATGTLTIPNTSKGLNLWGTSGLPPGAWTVTVSDFAYECATGIVPPGSTCTGGSTAGTYDVTVIAKLTAGSGIPASGGLDVKIYFATTKAPDQNGANTTPLLAANANADQDLIRMKQTLTSILAGAKITVNSVVYRDLPADVQTRYATGVNVDQSGACGPLSQLLKLSEPGNTLNIFFVSSFQSASLQPGQLVVGIDGTIPGPATVGGTVASGAAVATADLRAGKTACAASPNTLSINCGADETAYIIAHEAGHFLGLYHTTEAEGTLFDPLSLTPPCPCQTCAPLASRSKCVDSSPRPAAGAEHQMSVAECTVSQTCGGGDDLMFWILDSGSLGTVLPEQAQVMRANPLVQ
jgi:hypothetical protein